MLNPSNDRINFGEALRPENGYELDFALGTSYTLDLEAVMFLPVALFFGQDLQIEKSISNELLSALSQVPEKVQLFCQRGKIKSPKQYHNILEFWSESIAQIQMDDYNESFHPKIWLLRYVASDKKKPITYRFICTSRNLTKSADWDLAVSMNGVIGKTKRPENKPLLDFVKWLYQKSNKEAPHHLLGEIEKIHFKLKGEREAYNFYPIGKQWPNPLSSSKLKYDELLVISPFLDLTTIKNMAAKTNALYLFSMQHELDSLPLDLRDLVKEVYQFNPLLEMPMPVVDETVEGKDWAAFRTDETADEFSGKGLHAKLFVTRNGDKVIWYIGSANCTSPAHDGRNIEFLTAISSTDERLHEPLQLIDTLTESTVKREPLFRRYDKTEVYSEEPDGLDEVLRPLIYDIGELQFDANVKLNKEGLYDYEVIVKNFKLRVPDGTWSVFFEPLTRGLKSSRVALNQSQQAYSFPGYEIHQLTPYFQFVIERVGAELKTLVIKLDMTFPEDRMRKIYTSLIGNKDSLMKYLGFLLSKDRIEPLMHLDATLAPSEFKKSSAGWGASYPLYERLLYAASRDQEALQQTIRQVEMLKDELDLEGNPLIDEEFYTLIKTFKAAVAYER